MLLYIQLKLIFLDFERMSQRYLKYKYRQAAANLAKQPKNQYISKIDPLSQICSQRLQLIKRPKDTSHSLADNSMPKPLNTIEGKQEQDQHKTKLIKKNKKTKNQSRDFQYKFQINWQKYLPQQCDQFGQKEVNASKFKIENKVKQQKKIQLEKPLNVTQQLQPREQINNQKQQNCAQINIEQLKLKLGIGVAKQMPSEPTQKIQQIKLENKKQSPQAALLPFAGRPFEQAPPRPTPKKIYEYPPTCKVAGLYPWPPPKSQWRSWKAQMKESRKLK